MLPDIIRATLVALVASAVSVSGAPSLYVKVSGEPAVTGVDKLVVKTTVTNTGNEILTLLNHPQSPLNKLPADTFAISDATGSTPDFTGVKVKYVLSTAIATGKDAVTVIAPGQSIELEHNLSEAYAFSKEGKYEVVSNNLFYVVDDQKQAVPVYATVEGHTTKLTGRLAVPRPSKPIKRATYNGCTISPPTEALRTMSMASSLPSHSLAATPPRLL
ncbi:hypothetical protein H0H93_003152 [Arthromyces matolae]|nr:hypothetical protein H0H93_003152 [Arthromyces matolae]